MKNMMLLIIVVCVLLSGADALAMRKTDLQGKVTAVKGNVVTITTIKGEKISAEVQPVEGIKIGDQAWCEEDCGKGMKIGSKVVNVKRTLK